MAPTPESLPGRRRMRAWPREVGRAAEAVWGLICSRSVTGLPTLNRVTEIAADRGQVAQH